LAERCVALGPEGADEGRDVVVRIECRWTFGAFVEGKEDRAWDRPTVYGEDYLGFGILALGLIDLSCIDQGFDLVGTEDLETAVDLGWLGMGVHDHACDDSEAVQSAFESEEQV